MKYQFEHDPDDVNDALDWIEREVKDQPITVRELAEKLRAQQPTTQPPLAESG